MYETISESHSLSRRAPRGGGRRTSGILVKNVASAPVGDAAIPEPMGIQRTQEIPVGV